MIQIDKRYDEAAIRQFASQAEFIPPKVRHLLIESLLLEEKPDFYHGQLAVLNFCHQLVPPGDNQAVMACAMAIISKHIVDKGWW